MIRKSLLILKGKLNVDEKKKPFEKEGKGKHEKGSEHETKSDHDHQIHSIVDSQFVENVDSCEHRLNQKHQKGGFGSGMEGAIGAYCGA